MTNELVLILDFGSQFGQLIARRVRELNVFCQVVRHDVTADVPRVLRLFFQACLWRAQKASTLL